MDRRVRRAVLDHLAQLDEMAKEAGATLPVPVAREQLRHITDSWRELLAAHQPTASDRCPVCKGWLRHRRWPCQVWLTAHQRLIGGVPDSPPLGAAGARRNPFRRPRRVEVLPRDGAQRPQHPETPEQAPEPSAPPIHRSAVVERQPARFRGRLGRRAS